MGDMDPNSQLQRDTLPARRRPPRKVSALTAHQVQHKRDLDRKAQRALRQRVKSRMQDLEDDLARAKADCSVREQKLMEEVQHLREENRKLRSFLDSIGQFVRTAAERGNDSASPDRKAPGEDDELDESRTVAGLRAIGTIRDGRESPVDQDANMSSSYRNLTFGHLDLPSPGTGAVLGTTNNTQYRISPGEQDKQLSGMPPGLQEPIVAPSHSTLTPTWAAPLDQGAYQPSISTRISCVLPKHSPATCPLDQVLLDFISSRRSMVAKGYSMDSILGSPRPPLQEILYPGTTNAHLHGMSRVLVEILTTFSHVALPEKLALMFVLYRTMRWQLSPTSANHEEMPRWLRPTATQITVPHAAWIDNIPWPRVRDMLIDHPDKYPFPVFSELYSQNVTINWPYEDMDTVSTNGENVEFNSIFEKHVRKLENWTVLDSFKEYMPEMTPAIYGRD